MLWHLDVGTWDSCSFCPKPSTQLLASLDQVPLDNQVWPLTQVILLGSFPNTDDRKSWGCKPGAPSSGEGAVLPMVTRAEQDRELFTRTRRRKLRQEWRAKTQEQGSQGTVPQGSTAIRTPPLSCNAPAGQRKTLPCAAVLSAHAETHGDYGRADTPRSVLHITLLSSINNRPRMF